MDVIIENGSTCVFHRVAVWIVKSMLINGESRALPVFRKFTFRSHGMRFPPPCENYYACNACNFQMKLIHRFNRPISAPNFPQFPGNVPFCPRSPVPPPPPIAPGSPSPWLLATPFHHEFVPAKNIHREITALSERREIEDREGESAYLFLMLTGGHVCGWRVACNQCARRV